MKPSELLGFFKKGPYASAYKTIQEQLQMMADELVLKMKAAAPVASQDEVSGSVVRGALRDSIRKEKGKDAFHVLVKAGGPTTTHGGYDYARAVEFGTQSMEAEPFFFNTYNANKNRLKEDVKQKVRAEIERYSSE